MSVLRSVLVLGLMVIPVIGGCAETPKPKETKACRAEDPPAACPGGGNVACVDGAWACQGQRPAAN